MPLLKVGFAQGLLNWRRGVARLFLFTKSLQRESFISYSLLNKFRVENKSLKLESSNGFLVEQIVASPKIPSTTENEVDPLVEQFFVLTTYMEYKIIFSKLSLTMDFYPDVSTNSE